MRELHVVALSEDGRHVVLATRAGTAAGEFRVALDDRLAAAVRGELPPPGRETAPSISPREIQARLRDGETAEQIAAGAGVPLSRVERYAWPVLAELESVVAAAREAVVTRARLGASALPLGAAVQTRLSEVAHLAEDSVRWSARRTDPGRWVVEVHWTARGRRRTAGWHYDPATRQISAVDGPSAVLGHVEADAAAAAAATGRSSRPAAPAARGGARPGATTGTAASARTAPAPVRPRPAAPTSRPSSAAEPAAGAETRMRVRAAGSSADQAVPARSRSTGSRSTGSDTSAGAVPADRPGTGRRSARPSGTSTGTAGGASAGTSAGADRPAVAAPATRRRPAPAPAAPARRAAAKADQPSAGRGAASSRAAATARTSSADDAAGTGSAAPGRRAAGAATPSAARSSAAAGGGGARRTPPRSAAARRSAVPSMADLAPTSAGAHAHDDAAAAGTRPASDAARPPSDHSSEPVAAPDRTPSAPPPGPPVLRVVPAAEEPAPPERDAADDGAADRQEPAVQADPRPARRAAGQRASGRDWADVLMGGAPAPADPRQDSSRP